MNIVKLQEISAEQIAMFKDCSESELKHINEPEKGYFIAESPKVIERAMSAGYEPLIMLMEERHLSGEAKDVVSKAGNIPIIVGESREIRQYIGYELTRGALSIMKRKEDIPLEECFKDMKRIVILDNVENPTNIGAIVRSAAALGIEGILFAKGCADPLFRRAIRVSMGNIFLIPWTRKTKDDYMDEIHSLGFKTVAMALKNDSVRFDDEVLKKEEKLAIIMGNEGEGLTEETLEKCDYTVMIPMKKGVDSLNVSAAAAIAFWQLAN